MSRTCTYQQNLRVFKESLLFRKCNAQMLDIFNRAPSYRIVLVALECRLSSLHVLCKIA